MAIQMRRGNVADLDTSKLVAGEIVVGLDEDFVAVAKAPSDIVQLATQDDVSDAVSGIIDNSTTSSTKTWSSSKISSELSSVGGIDNAYKGVKVGNTTMNASGEDTVEFIAGSNVTLTPNSQNKSVTISASGGGGGGGSAINYSTSEQDTGLTWIDGSAVYQKTISATIDFTDESYTETLETELGKPISIEGVAFNEYGGAVPLPHGGAINTFSYDYQGYEQEATVLDARDCILLYVNPSGDLIVNWGEYTQYGYTGDIFVTVRYIKESNNEG